MNQENLGVINLEFEVDKYDGKTPIFIYGAGVFGEYTLRALEFRGIKPNGFCDRAKCGRDYLGLHIYDYKYLYSMNKPIVLLAVGAQYKNAADFLEKTGIEYLDIYKLCFEDTTYDFVKLSTQARDILYYRRLYLFGKNTYGEKNNLTLFSIDWVITEKCSLRCRDCSNLMQYYHSPKNKSKMEAMNSLTKLLDVVDGIFDVRVIGGEPFMNQEMPYMLEEAVKLDKIQNLSIYTNATILPNEHMIAVMKNNKIKCEISDYGKLSRNLSGFIEIMEKENIRYHVVNIDEWHELGPLKNRNMTIEEMKKIFSQCYCNDLLTLLDGKVYRCPHSAHGRNLEAIPYHEEDVVDLSSGSREYNRNKLQFMMFEKNYDYACGYCSGRNYHLGSVTPAIQTDHPLEYDKIHE